MRSFNTRRYAILLLALTLALVPLMAACGSPAPDKTEDVSVDEPEQSSSGSGISMPAEYLAVLEDDEFDYYALIDLNNDGTPELLVAEEDEIFPDGVYEKYDGNYADSAEVYTIVDGELEDLGYIGGDMNPMVYISESNSIYVLDSRENLAMLGTYYMDDYEWDDEDKDVLLLDTLWGYESEDPDEEIYMFLRNNVTEGAGNYEETELDVDEFEQRLNKWMDVYDNAEPIDFTAIA